MSKNCCHIETKGIIVVVPKDSGVKSKIGGRPMVDYVRQNALALIDDETLLIIDSQISKSEGSTVVSRIPLGTSPDISQLFLDKAEAEKGAVMFHVWSQCEDIFKRPDCVWKTRIETK